MGKKRWQRGPGNDSPQPIGPKTPAGRRGRWRERAAKVPEGPSRSNLKMFGGLFALVIVLALIVAAILVLRPLPATNVTLITAEYRVPLIAPNAFATADAEAIFNQSRILDVSATDADSLNFEEMQARVSKLSDVKPRRSWFGSQPSRAMVYVNAIGFAVWDDGRNKAVPYILADDFQVPTRLDAADIGQAIRVRNILENFGRCEADQKIVVLDCQRMDSLWPLGVLANEFVDSLREEVTSLPEESRKGLIVLSSCSPGEVTWVARDAGRSMFGRSFSQSMAGAADKEGNKDGYVSVGELFKFTRSRVQDAARSAADIQTPSLIYVDPAIKVDDVRLVSVPWGSGDAAPSSSIVMEDKAVLDRLRNGWERYYKMASDPNPPWRLAPQQWRFLKETLLRAEGFYRAGDYEAAELELSTVPRREADVRDVQIGRFQGIGYTLPIDKLLAEIDNRRTDSTFDSEFSQLVSDLLRGEDFQTFEARLGQGTFVERLPPIEAYFGLELAQNLNNASNSPARVDAARQLVALRVLAEKASCPADVWAPETFPWIRQRMEEADHGRRLLEDRFLAEGSSTINVGTGPPPISRELVDQLYQKSIEQADTVARGLRARQLILAELLNDNRFVARRAWGSPWQSADESFRKQTEKPYDALIRGLVRLNSRLAIDPTRLSRDALEVEISALDQAREEIDGSRSQLLEAVAAEARKLGKSPTPAPTETVWRRIHDLLLLPAASHPESPDESARTRVYLLQRVCQPVLQAGEGAAGPSGGREVGNIDEVQLAERRERARQLAELAREYYSLGTRTEAADTKEDLSGIQNTVHLGAMLARSWRETRDLAVSRKVAPDRREELFAADTARRLIEGYVAPADVLPHPMMLRRLDLADFFAWQTSRFSEDFWAGQPGEPRDYFEVAATAFLNYARDMHPQHEAAYGSLGDRIVELTRLATEIALDSEPARIRFTVREEEEVDIEPVLPAGLPVGIAALHAQTQPSELVLRQESDQKYFVNRAGRREGSALLNASLRYRGHIASDSVQIVLADDENGPTTVYRDNRPAFGGYTVRLAESDVSDLKLLFVLDCSRSMSSDGRITKMNQVLKRFAEETPPGAVEVGVRLFGSRYEFSKDPQAASTDSERVLDIASFDPRTFVPIIPDAGDIKGETPLFHALLEARHDFDNVRSSNKQIVVISDGQDNWVRAGKREGVPEIREAYKGSGIRINTIGFFLDDLTELSEIAKVTEGSSSKTKDPDELLRELTGLVGILSYAAYGPNEQDRVPDPPAKLVTRPTEYPLSPGVFQIRVTDTRGQAAAEPFPIRVRPGDLHELVFRGRRLAYLDDALAYGQPIKGPKGTELRVLRSSPSASGVELTFALYRPDDPLWQPSAVHVFVEPEGSGERYVFHHLPPNQSRLHVPAWTISLEDWPPNLSSANLTVSWAEPSEPIEVRPNQPGGDRKLPRGIEIGKPRFLAPPDEFRTAKTVVLKMAFSPERRATMNDWYLGLEQRVRQARQIYNTDEGIYTGFFVLEGGDQLDRVLVYPPAQSTDDAKITARIKIEAPGVGR